MASGIYAHLPFCAAKCRYCAFVSFVLSEAEQKKYIERLTAEILSSGAEETCAGTVFLGGGTPSAAYPGAVGAVMRAIRERFLLEPGAEISAEANPHSLSGEKAEEFARAGVNRVSLGLQSANKNECAWAGRLGGIKEYDNAVASLKSAGINNIGCDLMLGLKAQTEKTLADSINRALEPGITHVSVYALTVEEGTPVFSEGYEPDGDYLADLYAFASETLIKAGYFRYEVSNFAKPGFMCRHNLKYWRRENYLGFGAAAHSFFGGRRFFNSSDMKEYFDSKGGGSGAVTERDALAETVMLSLRLAEGLDLNTLKESYGVVFPDNDPAINELISKGAVKILGGRLTVCGDYVFVLHQIIVKILDALGL